MMWRPAISFLLLCCAACFAQQPLHLPDGTGVDVRLKTQLSSDRLHNGDIVEFEVVEPVTVEGKVVICPGETATAQVVGSNAAGHFEKQGHLAWVMQAVKAVDGTSVPLRFIKELPQNGAGAKEMSKKKKAAVAAAMSPVALYYSPAIVAMIPFWAARKGKPEIIPAGERYLVFVDGDTPVNAAPEPHP